MAWLRFYVIGEFGLNASARCLSFNASFRHYRNAKSSRRSSFVRNSATAATARTRFQVRRRVEPPVRGSILAFPHARFAARASDLRSRRPELFTLR